MNKIHVWFAALWVAIVLSSFGTVAQAAESYTVKRGDTLSTVFGKDWKAVCGANSLKDCNKIRVGQKIVIPGKAQVNPPAKSPEDVFHWRHVGGAPLNGCGAKSSAVLNEEAWSKLGLSDEEKTELREKVGAKKPTFTQRMLPGKKFLSVAFCEKGKVSFRQNVAAAWSPSEKVIADTYVLSSGRKLLQVTKCGNWAVDEGVVPVSPPVVATPPVPEPSAAPAMYEHQVDAYAGYGHVWHKDSDYGYVGFDWYLKKLVFVDKDGHVHRFGFGADYSAGSGQAGADGNFHWDALTLRPVAYKLEGKDGKTLRLRVLAMRVRDGVDADMDRYQNDRKIYYWGPEVIFTDQGRKDDGHIWFSEYRFSAALLFAFNKSGSHSWEGTPITDTAELLKVKGMMRGGARLYIYDMDGGYRTFVQAGLAVQWKDVARSIGISVGIEGPDELWTVFVGPNYDLKNHTHSFGAEVSLQIGKAYLHYRGLAAMVGLSQAVECIEKDGYAYFQNTGVLVPGLCPKDTAAGEVKLSQLQ